MYFGKTVDPGDILHYFYKFWQFLRIIAFDHQFIPLRLNLAFNSEMLQYIADVDIKGSDHGKSYGMTLDYDFRKKFY